MTAIKFIICLSYYLNGSVNKAVCVNLGLINKAVPAMICKSSKPQLGGLQQFVSLDEESYHFYCQLQKPRLAYKNINNCYLKEGKKLNCKLQLRNIFKMITFCPSSYKGERYFMILLQFLPTYYSLMESTIIAFS